jgi:hypothetical protein
MELETIATGSGAAALVWLLLRVMGRWAARHRWTVCVQSEAMEAIAKEREELRIKTHELELQRSAALAEARVYRAQIDRHLGIGDHHEKTSAE